MRKRACPLILGVLGLGFASACGGGDDAGDGGPDAGIDVSSLTYEPCALDQHVGGFDIILGDGFTSVQGQVFDRITPSRVVDTLATDVDCRWVRAPSLVCNPTCGPGMTCGLDSTCGPTPVAQDVGTVTAAGLYAEVSMAPRPPAYFYNFTGTLPHPGFAAGAGMRVDGTGFSLLGWGITPLAGVPAPIQMQRGMALPLTWTALAPGQTGPAKIEISVNVNGHGLVGSHIECVVDDTGSFTVPEPLITSLIDDGLSGFPTLTIRRTTTDSATIAAGCIELDVESSVTADVTIPGLTSCDGNEDCTPPETCQSDLTCG
jgi:hypothetical protein